MVGGGEEIKLKIISIVHGHILTTPMSIRVSDVQFFSQHKTISFRPTATPTMVT